MQVDLKTFRERVDALLKHPGMPAGAKERAEALQNVDPYPEVPPALLHAGHLASYVVAAGIIDPFDPANLTKPATYLVPVEGMVRYVDRGGAEQRFVLSKDSGAKGDVRPYVIIESNAVCYVTLQPAFRFPAYIAARFNLLIRDVYRGLLVGTGPLVDPGFDGQLSIPVHNFTTNNYRLNAGEGFVYFEFTKLSWPTKHPENVTIPTWLPAVIEVQPPFPSSKKSRHDLDDYLAAATSDGQTPKNSVVAHLTQLEKTNKEVQERNRLIETGAVVAAILFLVSVVSALVGAWQLGISAQEAVEDARTTLREVTGSYSSELDAVKAQLGATNQELSNFEEVIAGLGETIEALRAQTRPPEQLEPTVPAPIVGDAPQ